MIKKKKTMYEILEVAPNASYSEIKAAHQSLSDKLQSEKTDLNREDFDFKLSVINVAFHTLSTPISRDAYDAQLATLNAPENVSASRDVVVLKPVVESIYLRSDAASLRADAALLRAEALLLRADAMSLKISSTPLNLGDDNASPIKMIASAFSGLASPLKKLLTILGTLVALSMVLQVVFLLLANRETENTKGSTSEKLYLQNYYQENGVRPASKIEADILDAERSRVAAENRLIDEERRTSEREKQRIDEGNQRFADESRRMGEKVSENLRRDEERARDEAERKQEKLEQEKRRLEEAEINRIEREKDRWRRN